MAYWTIQKFREKRNAVNTVTDLYEGGGEKHASLLHHFSDYYRKKLYVTGPKSRPTIMLI